MLSATESAATIVTTRLIILPTMIIDPSTVIIHFLPNLNYFLYCLLFFPHLLGACLLPSLFRLAAAVARNHCIRNYLYSYSFFLVLPSFVWHKSAFLVNFSYFQANLPALSEVASTLLQASALSRV